MTEEIAGDLVRNSKVFLFPFFLYCEKHICCRSCCKSFDVRHRRRKGRSILECRIFRSEAGIIITIRGAKVKTALHKIRSTWCNLRILVCSLVSGFGSWVYGNFGNICKLFSCCKWCLARFSSRALGETERVPVPFVNRDRGYRLYISHRTHRWPW